MSGYLRRTFFVLALAVLFVSAGIAPSPVAAQPEVPGAPVDLIDVETVFNQKWGEPGDPGQNLDGWIEVKNLTGQNQFVLEQIIESQNDTIILERAVWVGPYDLSLWQPRWQFKPLPDAVRVRIYYWDYNINGWAFADRAIGWLQADEKLQGNPGHWPWSPNMYKQMRQWSSPDPNYHWVEIRFWYFDNSVYGTRNGSDRLNRMKQVTNTQTWGGNFGKFQAEFRRMDAEQRPKEGWDAVYEDWSTGYCVPIEYGLDSNLPGRTTSHEELNVCGTQDEEAEVRTVLTEQMSVYLGQDPTDVWKQNNAPIYRFALKVYRHPAAQGQPFVLQTEFEMLDDVPADMDGFDVEIPIRDTNWHF